MRAAPRLDKWLPWIALAVLAAGVVAFAMVKLTSNGGGSEPKQTKPEPTVPLSKEARGVAVAFIRTAVARRNLAAAWKLAGAPLKEGTTYSQWLSGNIRVVPYPVGPRVRMRVDYSHPDDAGLDVLLRPKPGVRIEPQPFVMELRRVGDDGRRWVVTYWAPKSAGLPGS